MLTKSKIQSLFEPQTYNRGCAFYEKNKIIDFTVDAESEFDYVNAVAAEHVTLKYHVSMIYDKTEDLPSELECQCPSFYHAGGPCHHCAALLLKYENFCNRHRMEADQAAKQKAAKEKLEKIGKGWPPAASGTNKTKHQTTPEIKKMLYQTQMKKALPLIQENLYGMVRLEPRLSVRQDRVFMLEFKVGVSQMYVLKDIYTFVNDFKTQENVIYGRKLQFVHCREMFDESSKPLLDFLFNWAEDNRRRYLGSAYYGFYNRAAMPSLRFIDLTSRELEAFLDAMGSRPFFFSGFSEMDGGMWKVVEERPPLELKIIGRESGIEVRFPGPVGKEGIKSYLWFADGTVYKTPLEQIEEILPFLDCLPALPGRKAFIRAEDVPVFCRELLPALEEHFCCQKVRFDESDYGIIPVSFQFYLDAPKPGLITCRPVAVYGDKKYDVYNSGEEAERRDLAKEAEAGRLVSYYCNAYDEENYRMAAANEDLIYGLLTEGIPKMQQAGEVLVSDSLKPVRVLPAPKAAVTVSITAGMLELSMTAGDMSWEELVEILSKYDRKKRYYRLPDGTFLNMEEGDLKTLAELKDGLGLSDEQLRQNRFALPKYRAMYLDGELKEHPALAVGRDRNFKSLVRNMRTVEDNDFEIPPKLEGILREYQKRGFLWIKTLKANGFGGILADDMGLGKTLQVIAFLTSEFAERNEGEPCRCLIVSPASLVYNWDSEFRRFAPHLPVAMVTGTALERRKLVENCPQVQILLTSYDLLKRDSEVYETLCFQYQVIDEAQYIKNHSTQAAKAVKLVEAGFKLALTGTPVENRLSELWSIFDYLMPGFLYSYQKFKKEVEAPVVLDQDEAAMRKLKKMITPFVLRRLKSDVLSDLPDKIEKNLSARLEGEQQKLYDAHVKRLKLFLEKQSDEELRHSKIQILAELTKLRQICCDPGLIFEGYRGESVKTDLCVDLICNAVEGGHKILLFSQFTSMLERLEERLKKENIPFYSLTGSTGKEKRMQLVEAFNRDDTPVFCISLKAGGTGLNLTGADIVIHYDPWWNLAVQNQATDRAHRIGQKQVVTVYRLIANGTIEENITMIQEKKRMLAEEILSGEGMKAATFSREELMELL